MAPGELRKLQKGWRGVDSQFYVIVSWLAVSSMLMFKHFEQHWPHTPHEANLVIERLHDLARALLFGARKDDAIVASFLEKRGLSILVEALLAVSTPEMIRTQAWQSLSVILLNVKDSFVRHTGTHSHT